MRDLGFDEVVGWSFTDPGEAGRLRIPAGRPARRAASSLANPLSEDQSVMRTTAARLAARRRPAQPRPRRRLASPSSSPAASTCAPTTPATGPTRSGRFPGERPAPVAEPHRLGCLAVGPLVAKSWRGGGEPADFFALKGVLEGARRPARRRARLRAGAGAVPAPGPLGAGAASAATPAGWIGELHPLVCRELGPRGRGRASRSTWRRWSPPPRRARRSTRTSPPSRPSTRTSPSSCRPRSPPPSVRAAVLAGGGELLRAAEVFDLYEGEQLGEGRKSLALRLEFRAADRTLTDEEVAAPARRDRGRAGEDRGSLRG